ncbi:hypothetical protein [Pseudarthrobacter sp. PvP090]|uniref:hypothetical protein n=1 Tax=Pseudarthrobacter sp. PvP090 TaxID=3156393 RepID=UPI0033998483
MKVPGTLTEKEEDDDVHSCRGATQVPPSCVCQGGSAEMPAVHVACTPSSAGAPLSAPQPGTTPLEAQPWSAALSDRLSGYARLHTGVHRRRIHEGHDLP